MKKLQQDNKRTEFSDSEKFLERISASLMKISELIIKLRILSMADRKYLQNIIT